MVHVHNFIKQIFLDGDELMICRTVVRLFLSPTNDQTSIDE